MTPDAYYMITLLTFALHVFADFHLQGCLSFLKTKEWWEEHCPGEQYQNDYRAAMLTHAFEWSFFVMLPVASWRYYTYGSIGRLTLYMFLLNIILHYTIDDRKANKKIINLAQDQMCHYLQLLATITILT